MIKSIYLYKELTAAEVGNTKTHEVYIRLPNNFDYQEFFDGAAYENGSVVEAIFTAKNLSENGKLGETYSLRFVHYVNNANQEKRIPSLSELFSSNNVEEGDIVCLKSCKKNGAKSFFIQFFKKGEIHISPSSIYFSTIEDEKNSNDYIQSTDTEERCIDTPYRQYITAIKSKPFLLLAGISGNGKSRIVRELARSCWDKDSKEYKAKKPKNFEMIQVKPNWHDSSELFGYVSRIKEEKFIVGPFLKFMAKALKEPDVPYFLCLDEMNLAPVEQYFAEYLSVIESRKLADDGSAVTDPIVDFEATAAYHSLISELFPEEEDRKPFLVKEEEKGKRLSIPPNLIVVGTVNMDETTFSFSRKVLDRAMTIEMNEVDLWRGLTDRYEPIERQSTETLIGTAVEGRDVYTDYKEVCDTCLNYLQSVNEVLEETPFKVAYRTRNEVLLYVVNNLPYNKSADGTTLPQEYVVARALDEITNMKILSRIEGDESKVRKDFLDSLVKTISEGLKSILDDQNGAESVVDNDSLIEKSVSLAKLKEMTKKLEDSGYTSYWS